MKKTFILCYLTLIIFGCKTAEETVQKMPFDWDGANVYFLLTDWFNNGNPDNDNLLNRNKTTGVLRGFKNV